MRFYDNMYFFDAKKKYNKSINEIRDLIINKANVTDYRSPISSCLIIIIFFLSSFKTFPRLHEHLDEIRSHTYIIYIIDFSQVFF